MNLLDYHRLRHEEMENWDLPQIEATVIQQDPTFAERVRGLLPRTEDQFPDDLQSVVRGTLFERLAELSHLYLQCSPQQRIYMRSRLIIPSGTRARVPEADRLESFGLRAAVIGLREGSLDMVKAGLAAFALADLGADVRETLTSITVLFHAAKRLGADAAGLFREIAAIAGPAIAAILIDFAGRPEDLQTLASMGWREVETPQGIGFQWGFPRRPRSSRHKN